MNCMSWNRKIGVSFLGIFIVFYVFVLFFFLVLCNFDRRVYKDGYVILGGLFNFYFVGIEDYCGDFFIMGLGYVEVMIFVIESVNENFCFFLNVIFGYDI